MKDQAQAVGTGSACGPVYTKIMPQANHGDGPPARLQRRRHDDCFDSMELHDGASRSTGAHITYPVTTFTIGPGFVPALVV